MIPLAYQAAGALALTALGFGAGWKVNDWRRDSRENAALKAAEIALTKASAELFKIAGIYQKESTDETAASQVRQGELRTIYRDVVVGPSCAAPAAAGRVLDNAIARANARAAGEPVGALPVDPASPESAGRP